MVVIWGVNYSVIKRAFDEIPPQPFNALRLMLASSVFLIAIRVRAPRPRAPARCRPSSTRRHQLTTRDWWDLLWLGLVGHCGYQFLFCRRRATTSVSNAALIIGCTPVVVAVVSALLGRERIARCTGWAPPSPSAASTWSSATAPSFGGATFRGDLLIMASVGCWAAYTLGASRLIARHSPLYVTGMTMAIGGIPVRGDDAAAVRG